MPPTDRDDALRDLGRLVTERREEANLTLEDIYDRTRIRMEFLRGIEAGEYEGFPDIVYIKGFIRTYLRLIHAEDLQGHFNEWLDKAMPKEPDEPINVLGNGPLPTKGFRPVSHFGLFAILLLALLGTGAYVWYVWDNGGFSLDRLRALGAGMGGVSSSSVALKDVSLPEVVPLPKVLSRDEVLVSKDVPPKPKEPPKPDPYLEIRATSDVWLRMSVGDKVLFSKTLRKGEVVSWDLPAQAKVTYGRPNAATVILNGKNLGLANPKGSRTAETYFYSPDGTHKKAAKK